jgi:pyruvate/2-oxoglutarate/acetoin dehydrogenase E1 component
MKYVESLNIALHQLMSNDDKVLVIGEDITDPYGGAFKVTKGLSSSFKNRVISTPISEAAITGFATGTAMRGFKPILEIMFGDFITLCVDQIVNGMTKFHWMYGEQLNVPILIRTPMGGRRGYGPTHSQTLEHLFLNISGLSIVAPSEFHNPGELLIQLLENSQHPVLFIESKVLYSKTLLNTEGDHELRNFIVRNIFKSNLYLPSISFKVNVKKDADITLIAYGGNSHIALDAILHVFEEEEIIVELIIPSMIKPLPLEDVLTSASNTGRVIIVEECCSLAAWGVALGMQIMRNSFSTLKKPVVCLGAKEEPIPSSIELEKEVLPQKEDIVDAIFKILT